jgi:hypothetical protein
MGKRAFDRFPKSLFQNQPGFGTSSLNFTKNPGLLPDFPENNPGKAHSSYKYRKKTRKRQEKKAK